MEDRELYDYENIKSFAKDWGVKVNDLLAMSTGSDPFYMGSERDYTDAQWFTKLFLECKARGILHLRGIHYAIAGTGVRMPMPLKQDDVKTDLYNNHVNCWNYLCAASSAARWLKMVPFEDLEDMKNDAITYRIMKGYNQYNPAYGFSVPDLSAIDVTGYAALSGDVLENLVVFFAEKSSVGKYVEDILQKYRVGSCFFSGQYSHTALFDVVQKAKEMDKNLVVLSVSDCDDAGISISLSAARRLEYLWCEQNMTHRDIVVRQLALTPQQVKRYNLPTVPAKKSIDSTFKKFKKHFGVEFCEIDAFLARERDVFRGIVEDAIKEFVDYSKLRETWQTRQEMERVAREEIERIKARYGDVLPRIEEMFEEIQNIEDVIDMSQFVVEPSENYTEFGDSDEDMLNSYRDYEEQLQVYKKVRPY